MYIVTNSSDSFYTVSGSQLANVLLTEGDHGSRSGAFWHFWRIAVHSLEIAGAWIVQVAPSLTWTVDMLWNAYSFLKAYPHPFHIITWSIFFGPIIILMPSLLLLEILILFLFNLSFLFHGLIAGSTEERFHTLKEYFMDTRESLFATVEHWTAVFNTWTVDYPPLLVLRLVAGAFGLFILFGIWSDWQW